MRVLAACSLGGAGHLQPMLPLLAAARRRGAQILVVGPPALREMVETTGYRFEAGGEPPEELVAPLRERLPVAPPAEASVLGNRELFARLAADAMLPAMVRICNNWEPDVVVRDPCEYASAVVAAQEGIPAAQVAISFAEAEAGSIAAAAPALEEHHTGLTDAIWASPYLTRFPGSLDPSPFTRTLRFHEPRAEAGSPSVWLNGRDIPHVYMSFGTVLGHMSIAAGVYRAAVAAVRDLDVSVLLTVGRRFDPVELGPVPAHVRVTAWVDQADVLNGADLVVCHGGSGTVFGALAAGVPVVIAPVFADQFENGRRIAQAGAGVTLDETGVNGPRRAIGEQDAPRITQAIATVLGAGSYVEGASRIAAEMAANPTASDVLEEVLGGQPPSNELLADGPDDE